MATSNSGSSSLIRQSAKIETETLRLARSVENADGLQQDALTIFDRDRTAAVPACVPFGIGWGTVVVRKLETQDTTGTLR